VACKFDHQSLHAQWNIRQSTVLWGLTNNHQDTSVQTNSHSSLEFLQQKKPTMAPLAQQLDLAPQSNGWTSKISPGSVQYVSNTTPSDLPHMPQSIALIGTSSILMATMIYLFIVQQSCKTGSAAPFATPPAPQHWSSPRLHPAPVVKSQKSCFWWTRAIIQRKWDTAWDLTTHWNVESCRSGLGWPTIKWNAQSTFCAQNALCQWPMYSLSFDRLASQLSNQTRYHSISNGRW